MTENYGFKPRMNTDGPTAFWAGWLWFSLARHVASDFDSMIRAIKEQDAG
jgi:hypothetical protein